MNSKTHLLIRFPQLVSLTARFAASLAVVGMFHQTNTLRADVVFTDTFDGTSYNVGELNSSTFPPGNDNPDDISEAFINFPSTGGNPGGFGEITHEHDVERDMNMEPLNGNGDTNLQSFFTNQNFSYNPAIDGAISSITFSLDYRVFDPSVSSVFFGVSDSNGGSLAAFSTPVASGDWETLTSGPTVQADFSSRDFAGALDLNFEFGFISDADVFNQPFTQTIDVDNFVVSIVTVPEPGSAALILCGAIGLGLRRRRPSQV